MADTPNPVEIEILVATTLREDGAFLGNMFVHNDISTFSVLIINQTIQGKELNLSQPNICVINSYEKGLSKSRNLALREAKGKYCLIADDDVVFLPDLAIKIKEGFEAFPQADVLSFMTLTTNKKKYWKYPAKPGPMPRRKIRKILSIEMAFQLEKLKKYNIRFNEYFGLGAEFPNGANHLFLHELQKKEAGIYFYPEYIVSHPPTSSSDQIWTDELLYANVARVAYFYHEWAWLFLVKYLFSIWRKSYISRKEIPHKIRVGIKSFKKFKELKPKIYSFAPSTP